MAPLELPAHCDYWLVKPGDDAIVGGEGDCDSVANEFGCTLDKNHALPHVASAVIMIAAVWDDVWYADGNEQSCPVEEVT